MMQKVLLIGNLGSDAEIKTFDNGNSVANFSLATSESYKDKSGEWQQKTEWHSIAVWGNNAERAAKLTKGTTLYLEGKLSTRKWQDKNGNDRYTTEVVASYFRIVNRSENPNSSTSSHKEPEELSVDDMPF